MEWLLKSVFAPAELFMLHPERAFCMAASYLLLIVISVLCARAIHVRRHLVALLTAMLWVFFGLNEMRAIDQGWNIRVDLLFAWPVLFACSAAAIAQEIYSLTRLKFGTDVR